MVENEGCSQKQLREKTFLYLRKINQSLNKYSFQRRVISRLGRTTELRYPQRHFKYWAGWGVERDIIIIIVIIIIIIIIIIIL